MGGSCNTICTEYGKRTQLKPNALMRPAILSTGCRSSPPTTKSFSAAPYQFAHRSRTRAPVLSTISGPLVCSGGCTLLLLILLAATLAAAAVSKAATLSTIRSSLVMLMVMIFLSDFVADFTWGLRVEILHIATNILVQTPTTHYISASKACSTT